MQKKRGLSDVVSTVLIILIVVAAIAVIGAIVMKTAGKTGPAVTDSILCQEIQVVPSKCTYNVSNPTVASVLVQRKDGKSSVVLSNLTFVFSDGNQTNTRYSDVFPAALEAKSYVLNGVGSPRSLSVYASVRGSDGRIVNCPNAVKVSCSALISGPMSSVVVQVSASDLASGSYNLNQSGITYILNESITGSFNRSIFNISVDDVIFDGAGIMINISATNSSAKLINILKRRNITVKNLVVYGNSSPGFYVRDSYLIKFENVSYVFKAKDSVPGSTSFSIVNSDQIVLSDVIINGSKFLGSALAITNSTNSVFRNVHIKGMYDSPPVNLFMSSYNLFENLSAFEDMSGDVPIYISHYSSPVHSINSTFNNFSSGRVESVDCSYNPSNLPLYPTYNNTKGSAFEVPSGNVYCLG